MAHLVWIAISPEQYASDEWKPTSLKRIIDALSSGVLNRDVFIGCANSGEQVKDNLSILNGLGHTNSYTSWDTKNATLLTIFNFEDFCDQDMGYVDVGDIQDQLQVKLTDNFNIAYRHEIADFYTGTDAFREVLNLSFLPYIRKETELLKILGYTDYSYWLDFNS